jgi:hypothetical protein
VDKNHSQREHGYCINIKQQDPETGAKTNKNVSSKDYYAYRLLDAIRTTLSLLLPGQNAIHHDITARDSSSNFTFNELIAYNNDNNTNKSTYSKINKVTKVK